MSIEHYNQYIHVSKDENADIAESFYLSDKALDKFVYSNYEVELGMKVNTDTGFSEIVSVNGRMLR